jgi:DegV family protein with EDD domain
MERDEMKKVAWIADTTASLSKDFIEKHQVHVVPLNLIFGDTVYREEEEISIEEFYKKMSEEAVSPTTSQPSIGDFVQLYEKLKEEYEMGIAIHASSELSGTYSTSVQAAEIVGFKLLAIDSRIGSYPIAKMFEKAMDWYEQGMEIEEMVKSLNGLTDKAELYLLPSNLEQLRRGGRLSNTKAILGTILKVNLIIKFENGKVVLSEKIRTEKKVAAYFKELFARINSETDEVCIVHADEEEKANKWKKEINALFPELKVRTMMLCSVAGVHTGKGTMAVSWLRN